MQIRPHVNIAVTGLICQSAQWRYTSDTFILVIDNNATIHDLLKTYQLTT